MWDVRLHLVTDRALARGRPVAELVRQAVAGGVTMVQLREKTLATKEFVALARALKAILAPSRVPLIVNDRLDVALAAEADGAHVGQQDMHAADARRLLGPRRILGLSVASPEQARAAESLPVDYLGVGPLFPTLTKTDTAASFGLEGLRRLRAASRLPLVAIGGLHAGNAADALAHGADGIAVVSAICAADDPQAAAAALRRIVDARRPASPPRRSALSDPGIPP